MQITKREFLKGLGLGCAAMATDSVRADEYMPDMSKLPPGSCGDPALPGFGRHIFPLPHTMQDLPSCSIVDGEVVEPARKIPIFHKTDVVVVGGGPAGFAAALASARTGAKTTLIERYGSLGGLFTNGMVLIMLATSFREENGRYRLVTKGICEEFMRRSLTLGSHVSAPAESADGSRHWQPTVDPEGAKYLMDRMAEEAGIDVFFHSWGVDTIQDGDKVRGIVFESKQGRQAILAKQVVDCTGDADVLFQAGGDYRQISHAIGHVVRLGNVDRITAKSAPLDAAGKPIPGRWILRGNEGNPSTWWGNTGAGPTGNGLDIRDLTKAEIEFRREWWEHVAKMRKTPGWEEVFLANTCSQIGPRASRLIAAEHVVGRAEQFAGRRPEDTVAICGSDGVHPAPLYVPYRQILPKKIDNILCAGRCLGTGDTIDTFRLICPCFVTGEAAGTAAAMCAQQGIVPRELNVNSLQDELVKHGVCIA